MKKNKAGTGDREEPGRRWEATLFGLKQHLSRPEGWKEPDAGRSGLGGGWQVGRPCGERSPPVLRTGGRQHGRRRAATCGRRPGSQTGTCVPGSSTPVRSSELRAAVEAVRVVRGLSLGKAPPSSLPLSSACSPGGEGAPTSSSKPAGLRTSSPLTSCVTLGSYITTSFLQLPMYKAKIIIALPCRAVVRREDACIMCLALVGP